MSVLERLPWLTAFGWSALAMSFLVGFLVGLIGGLYSLMTIAAHLRS